MSRIFGIGLTGLHAAQTGIITTGHNITNASTVGFHRQEIKQVAETPQYLGNSFLGAGAQLIGVSRAYNSFLDKQLATAQTNSSYYNGYYSQVSQIDNMVADPKSGLSPAMQDFFAGVQDMATYPASVPSRQAMISTANTMVTRYESLNSRFEELRSGVNSQVSNLVSRINSYATQISELNNKIQALQGSGPNSIPNDIYDKRDQAIAELNKLVTASTILDNNNLATVFIGNGQTLVAGTSTFTLTAQASVVDPERTNVFYQVNGAATSDISSLLQGGELGGVLNFRTQALDVAQNSLGRVAIGMAMSFNDQHRIGQDLNGNAGGNFFDVAVPKVVPSGLNTGTGVITTTILNPVALTISDYTVDYNAGNYTITRLSDNTITNATAAQMAAGVLVDGVRYTAAGAPANFDQWGVQPTRNGGRDIGVAISDPALLAAAAPMRADAAAANTGTGKITMGQTNSAYDKVTFTFTGAATYDVVDNTTGATLATGVAYASGGNINYNGWQMQIAGAPAVGDKFVMENTIGSADAANVGTGSISPAAIPTPPATTFQANANIQNAVTITFTGPNTFDVAGVGPGLPAVGQTYTASAGISFNGWTVKISGLPATGDVFSVGRNINGVADNRNGLELVALQARNVQGSNSTTLQGSYSQMVSSIGNVTSQVQIAMNAQDNLVIQVNETQQGFSGVSIDEEAANLIRFQQAYQASAKMLNVASQLFDEVLNLAR